MMDLICEGVGWVIATTIKLVVYGVTALLIIMALLFLVRVALAI